MIPAAKAISEQLRQPSPDEVKVALGVKLTAEAGVIMARAVGEGHFTVTLTWRGTQS